MARGAVWLRWAEGRTGMTGFATDIDMRAVEHEAGTEVIKRFFSAERSAIKTGRDENYSQPSIHCSDLTSWNDRSL